MNKIFLVFYNIFVFSLLPFSLLISMEEFTTRLMDTNSAQIQACDDTDRWISVKYEDYLLLSSTAYKQNVENKNGLINLGKRILDNSIKNINGNLLLTQKELFEGLIQYLPWDGKVHYSPAFIKVLIDGRSTTLNIGTVNFWYPNDVRIVSQS